MRRKAEEQTSATIFVVGFVIVIGVLIAAVMTSIGDIKIPLGEEQVTNNEQDEAAKELADLAERCWTDADGGTETRVIDCFNVKITVNDPVTREHVTDRIEGFDTEQLNMDEQIDPGTQTTVKVRYENGEVYITKFRVCEPSEGDTCQLVKCSCDPSAYPNNVDTSDVSQHCRPGYTAEGFINAPGAGDGQADTVPPLGCVETGFTDVQTQGGQCSFDFECSQDLSCNQAYPNAGSGSYCCPDDQRWDGQQCTPPKQEGESCSSDAVCAQGLSCNDAYPGTGSGTYCCPGDQQWDGQSCSSPDTYDVVFVPLNYGSSEFSQFRQKAEATFAMFTSESPFQACSSLNNRIQAHYLDDMGGSCTGICTSCPSTAQDRVLDSDLANQWDKVVGICKGSSCSTSQGACGCAEGIPGDASATNQIDCGGTAADRVGTHEMGHTMGLYHVEQCGASSGCTGPNAADCNEPSSQKQDFVMGYCTQQEFGPAAYGHLENNVFSDYLQGCNQ